MQPQFEMQSDIELQLYPKMREVHIPKNGKVAFSL